MQARQQLQDLLNEYGVGVRVRDVQLLAVDPPGEVIDAFNEVQRRKTRQIKNEAEAFSNDIVRRGGQLNSSWWGLKRSCKPCYR